MTQTPRLILPYAGSVAHWATIVNRHFVLEAFDIYERRTQRTRTSILTADGPIDMSVPIHPVSGQLYRAVQLNFDTDWTRRHVYALRTAYNSTPFFELYESDFVAFYERPHKLLWDFNIDLQNLIASLLGVGLDYELSKTCESAAADQLDLRNAIFPKQHKILCQKLRISEYNQVFSAPYTKRPFTPWLSIFDLLFNMGPESRLVLQKMQQ